MGRQPSNLAALVLVEELLDDLILDGFFFGLLHFELDHSCRCEEQEKSPEDAGQKDGVIEATVLEEIVKHCFGVLNL